MKKMFPPLRKTPLSTAISALFFPGEDAPLHGFSLGQCVDLHRSSLNR